MIREMHRVHWPDFDSDSLQWKDSGAVSNVAVSNAGLNRQNRKGHGLKVSEGSGLCCQENAGNARERTKMHENAENVRERLKDKHKKLMPTKRWLGVLRLGVAVLVRSRRFRAFSAFFSLGF